MISVTLINNMESSPQIIGFQWPGEFKDADVTTLKAALQYQLERREFQLLTKSVADGNIRGVSQAMAFKGYTPPFSEWFDDNGNVW
jgi:hypothetical protein